MSDDERPIDHEGRDDPTVERPAPDDDATRADPLVERRVERPPLPERLGPFRILGTLGEGGMGVVYEAEQDEPRRRVALKVIRAGALADETLLRMFQREADTLARLKHPGIAGIYQVGRTGTGRGQSQEAVAEIRCCPGGSGSPQLPAFCLDR